MVEAGVGAVQNSKSILPGLDLEEWPHFPVDQHRVTEKLRDFGFEERASLDEAVGEPCLGIAVTLRQRFVAMEVNHCAYLGCRMLIAVERRVDRQEVARGKVVHPLDGYRVSATGFEGWPR